MRQLSPPYRHLRRLFYRAQIVPFLGAGASFPDLQTVDSDPSANLPTGRQLARRLAYLTGLPEEEVNINNLTEVASYYALQTGRVSLEKKLEKVFDSGQSVGSLHYYLAEVPAPLLIVTTNYDTLIERAFRERGRSFHMVMTPVDRYSYDRSKHLLWWPPGAEEPVVDGIKEFNPTPDDLPVIYKIHGGFAPTGKWQRCVITEDDYFEIGGRIYESSLLPDYVRWRLQVSKLLFLGYSLRDIHVRHMIGEFRRLSNERRDLLVTKSSSRLERERFRLLGLDIHELTVEQFTDGLLQAGSSESASDNPSAPPPQ